MVSIVVICNVSRLAKGEDATARVTAILRAGRGRWRQHPPSPPLTIVSTMLALLELSRSKCVCVCYQWKQSSALSCLLLRTNSSGLCVYIYSNVYTCIERDSYNE